MLSTAACPATLKWLFPLHVCVCVCVCAGACRVVAMEWHNARAGHAEPGSPVLVVCLDNGRMQLMRHAHDDAAVCVDTGIRPTTCKWSPSGSVSSTARLLPWQDCCWWRAGSSVLLFPPRLSVRCCCRHQPCPDCPCALPRVCRSLPHVTSCRCRLPQMLAVAGYQAAPDGRQLWLVQFYSPAGQHLRTMRVPGGGSISGMAWEGGGARLALAVNGHIFFASVRQPHLWAAFAGTLAYAFCKPERPEHCLMFWNMHSNERTIKYVKRVSQMCAAADLCMLVTKVRPTQRRNMGHLVSWPAWHVHANQPGVCLPAAGARDGACALHLLMHV